MSYRYSIEPHLQPGCYTHVEILDRLHSISQSLYIHSSTHLSINPSSPTSVYPSILPSIYLPIHPSILLSLHLLIHSFIHISVIHLSIRPFAHSCSLLSIYSSSLILPSFLPLSLLPSLPSFYFLIYLSIHPFTQHLLNIYYIQGAGLGYKTVYKLVSFSTFSELPV